MSLLENISDVSYSKALEGSNHPVWKKAVTILIYKSNNPSNPKNFRPIALENVFLKVHMHRNF